MDFDAYQAEALKTDETKKTTVSLYGLSGEVGTIFSLFKKRVRDNFPFQKFQNKLKEELGDLLWYISSIPNSSDAAYSAEGKGTGAKHV